VPSLRNPVTTLATVLGYASGYALMRHHDPPAQMIATSIAIDLALMPLTVIIAARRRRPIAVWSVIGLLFGAWALFAALLIRPDRAPSQPPAVPRIPRPSDAA
jgi:hypothetical protein